MSGLTSGRGTNYGRIGYDLLATGQGTRVGAAYSTLHYMLGEPFTVLDAHGTAISKSAWLKTPFRRSSHLNLYGQVHYDALRLQDRIDAGWVRTDRHLSNTTLSFSGDTRDAVLGGGISGWNLGWKTGQLKFDNTHARMADAATAGTEGQFSKWNLYVYRLQGLGPKSGLFLAFAGQWTKANLDSSEKLIAGGPLTVRAYDVGAWSGDQGYIATAELRRDLGFARRSQWQGIAFIDHAELTLSHAPWVTGSNRVALTGVGVGVNCAVAANWSARISVAARIGSTSMAPTNAASARVWFEVGRTF